MSGVDWSLVSELFARASELDPGARDTFLDSIEDPAIRREVASLLSARESRGRFDELSDAMSGRRSSAAAGFAPGNDVGRFRIVREIARGGMATVYLAQDLKHERPVAVKVLRPELAAYLGAERFLREMRTMGRLQHPNILPLFDSGETDGLLYYVMPYVEDETLRDRLDREKQLGVEEAVSIAREVADALDYAHRHGVLHRDIKPGNILLHEGRPMLADFGIALPIGPDGPERSTEVGLSLGTPHYMSPEQASAEPQLTARSDVYSLGCVLYEMLAGRPPHSGGSPRAAMRAILTDEIEPVTDHRRSVPPNVAAATARALEKLPADRFGSARAFADALADPHFSAGGLPSGSARERSRSSAIPWLVGLVAIATLAAAWGWLRPTRPGIDLPVTEFTLAPPEADMSFRGGLALSPDGSRLVAQVHTDEGSMLYQRVRDSRDWRRMPGTEGVEGPIFFSPDGRWLGFGAGGMLKKVPLDGGGASTIIEAPSYWGGSWGPDDVIVYTATDQVMDSWGRVGMFRVSADGGAAERLTSPDTTSGEMMHFGPRHVPGTDIVLFTSVSDRLESRVSALSLTSREVVRLAAGMTPHATRDGRVVFVTPDGRLVVQAFDPASLSLPGASRPLAEGVARGGSTALFTMSDEGSFAFLSGPAGSDQLVLVDRDGRQRRLWSAPAGARMQVPRFSPSGDRLAFVLNDGSAWQGDVWVYSFESGTAQRLSFEGPASDPSWTRDGRAIGYSAIADGEDAPATLYLRAADGTGKAERILATGADVWQPVFGPDDREVVFYSEGRLHRLERDGGSEPRLLFDTEIFMTDPALSPDGAWLAYTSTDSGTGRVYVRSYPDLGPPVVVSGGDANSPAWSGDGSELFYWAGTGNRTAGVAGGSLVAASVRTDGGRFLVVDREELFSIGPFRTHYSRNYAVHPSGRQFVLVSGSGNQVVWRTNALGSVP